MTSIIVAPRIEDPLSDVEQIIDNGFARVRPSVVRTDGQWVMDDWSEPQDMTGAALTFALDPLADIPYELELNYTDKENDPKVRREFRIVTDSGTPLRWETLELRYAPGEAPVPTGDVEGEIAAINARIDTIIASGATNVTAVTGISAYARTYLDDTSQAATRTTLGVPAIGDAPTAHTHGVTDLTATGTKSSTVFLRGDNTWAAPPAAGAVAYVDVTGKPSTFPPTLPIASSGITGLDSALASLDSRITAVNAQISKTMAKVEQVGTLYPTPLPTGFYGIRFEGQSDPVDQAGITVQNTDEWVQLP